MKAQIELKKIGMIEKVEGLDDIRLVDDLDYSFCMMFGGDMGSGEMWEGEKGVYFSEDGKWCKVVVDGGKGIGKVIECVNDFISGDGEWLGLDGFCLEVWEVEDGYEVVSVMKVKGNWEVVLCCDGGKVKEGFDLVVMYEDK